MAHRVVVIAEVIIGLLSLAATPSQATESCMSKAEAREHFGAAPLYWHTSKHCWDATSKRTRKVVRAPRSINPPIPRATDQQTQRESPHPVQSEPASQTEPEIDAPDSHNAIAEVSASEPIQAVSSGDARPFADPAAAPQSPALASIFIVTACLAALWLIFQSADVITPARLPKLMYRPVLFLREFGEGFGRWIQPRRISDALGQFRTTRQAAAQMPTHASPSAAPVAKPALAPLAKRRNADGRAIIRISELEMAIGEAVKNAAPSCEAFVGVVIQRKQPESPLGANWELCGKKFGQADRTMANEALARVVKRMEKEFSVTES